MDEKRSAHALEEATSSLASFTCSFTVVQNAFIGLEFSECMSYDIIFINKDLKDFNALQFIKVLKNAGSPSEVVLLVDATDNSFDEKQAKSNGFHGMLRKEYQPCQLCDIIKSAL